MEPSTTPVALNSPPPRPRSVGDVVNFPLCFVCAKVEEYHFIQAALKRQKNDVLIEYTDLFYEEKSFTVGAIKAEKRSVNFFLTHGADQGPESFGIFCSRIFTLLKPKAAVLLGTCAARDSEKYNIADVAFGHSAYNYEEGKYMDEKTFNPDFLQRKSDLAKSQIGGFLARRRDQYHPAIFLTGSAVRQDANVIFNMWQKPRQADVLEMEASAFFNSCEHCHVAALGVVKGVSDYGDKTKYISNSIDYSTAISNATQAAVELSKYYCSGTSFTESPLESHGAQLAMNYCKNFLQNAALGILNNVKKVEYKDMEDTYEKKLYLVDPGVDGLALLEPANLRYHAKKCKLEHIAVGVDELRPLTLYYKNGKIFDYPTTLKGLKDHPEKAFNYEQFKSTVEQQKREMRIEEDVTFISIDKLEKQIEA